MIITGIQPTGNLHIGNYFGAIKPLIALQKSDPETYIFTADYHAITSDFTPGELNDNIRTLTALLHACGVEGTIFNQSAVPEHLELAHILSCTAARFGQLNRMSQFREKMEKLTENQQQPSVGLFTYPILQAADVLLYRGSTPTKVPVGEDQLQHLNLVVDIAQSFNSRFGTVFDIPEAIVSPTPKIMSLYDGQKKMSKSDPDDMNRINFSDTVDMIKKKYRKATSDPLFIPDSVDQIGERHTLRNLLTIYAAFADLSLEATVDHFAGKGFGPLKNELTDITVSVIEPIQAKAMTIDYPSSDLGIVREKARATLETVRRAIGLG